MYLESTSLLIGLFLGFIIGGLSMFLFLVWTSLL